VKCGTNSTCKQGSDCASGVCDGKDKVCNAASCRDGVANGDETDTDCGGEFCFKCANGKKCKVADDCASGICTALVCAHP
jgi:hypothetical protein